MLFLISWKISAANRVSCWNVFGNMTPEDDLKDAGPHIRIVGRWHHLSGDGGVCICDTNDSAALNSFMLNWSPICDITVNPVVDDAGARASIQTKPYFQAKDAAAPAEDAAAPAEDAAVPAPVEDAAVPAPVEDAAVPAPAEDAAAPAPVEDAAAPAPVEDAAAEEGASKSDSA